MSANTNIHYSPNILAQVVRSDRVWIMHLHMRGPKDQCCICAKPFTNLFPVMDYLDEIHPVEAAQIVVPLTEPVGRSYGWQYQEAFFEEGKDPRFNNLDYIIHINKLKRRQLEKELLMMTMSTIMKKRERRRSKQHQTVLSARRIKRSFPRRPDSESSFLN
ncbi:hypothetical protein PRIPAC_95326 [Pristionchus pacificus]|uniref:Uncharacterized protein n=1 Tax=Pristionchus pacificus TaxID=54126 RepID=A0A2A6BC75_PRIPA|nr:hypothetical protein PRIPAC_95326 [Pristionchus pacificus]|eukprot:PDM63492.1 hypothetical protein PRIPAC_53849 [Pristionchus pacificus]